MQRAKVAWTLPSSGNFPNGSALCATLACCGGCCGVSSCHASGQDLCGCHLDVCVCFKVTLQAFGGPVDETADPTSVLLFQLVDLLVFLVELFQLESARALVTVEVELVHLQREVTLQVD